ncbi:hypothetical protein D3C72_2518030 [compost metagenome]
MANLLRLTATRHFTKISTSINNVMLKCSKCQCGYSLIKVDQPNTKGVVDEVCLSCGNKQAGVTTR